jgi:BirA family transcriptional regulator, biotin operon repressor / biotin---[acetyl-CoA-carboxylase] ligase
MRFFQQTLAPIEDSVPLINEFCPFDLERVGSICGLGSLEYQATAKSTNDWALQLAADSQRRWPLLVLTARQTAGRGRGANAWWSADGALTFSLIVDAEHLSLPAERWPTVALAAGLGICESLGQLFPTGSFALKWPNDVYLGGRKLSGILVEAPSQSQRRIVIGVGINVNNSFAAAPVELRSRATALCDEAGGEFDLSETLCLVVEAMLQRVVGLATAEQSPTADFRRFCLLTGKTVQLDAGRERIVGRCQGIDDEGRLMLRTLTGLRTLHSGTVVAWDD